MLKLSHAVELAFSRLVQSLSKVGVEPEYLACVESIYHQIQLLDFSDPVYMFSDQYMCVARFPVSLRGKCLCLREIQTERAIRICSTLEYLFIKSW